MTATKLYSAPEELAEPLAAGTRVTARATSTLIGDSLPTDYEHKPYVGKIIKHGFLSGKLMYEVEWEPEAPNTPFYARLVFPEAILTLDELLDSTQSMRDKFERAIAWLTGKKAA